MSSELDDLYQEVILDHSKRPRNFGELEDANRKVDGQNPLCGDRTTIFLKVEDGIVRDAHFVGTGCSISMASASMMTEAVKGKSVAEAEKLFHHFHALITGEERDDDAPDLGKLAVFSGVCEFPVRVKCAALAWHTFKAALAEEQSASATTEDKK